jgi:hypothetical protein
MLAGWRKQAAGVLLLAAEKRTRTKDDDEENQDMALNRDEFGRTTDTP